MKDKVFHALVNPRIPLSDRQEMILLTGPNVLWSSIKFRGHCYMRSYRSSSTFVTVDLLFHELLPFLSPRNRNGDIVTLLWFRVCVCVRLSVRPSVRGPCEHDRNYTVACFFVKLGRHVNHDERMNPIDFGGQRSKVKVTMDIYGNKLVNTIETEPLCISLSNLADRLTMVRGWTLLILEVRGQRSRSQWTYMEISLWT